MTAPTLTISIDRSSLSLSPLVLSGTNDSNDLGVVNYTPPAKQKRLGQMPDAPDIDGTEYVSSSYQQSRLNFDFVTDKATSETELQALEDELAAAIDQFAFVVTTQVDGAPARAWSANSGDLIPPSRTYTDLANHNPVFAVSIPVFPIAS